MQTMNFFGAVQAMMMQLQAQILLAFRELLPLRSMMNLVWVFIASFFLWYFFEAMYKAWTRGSAIGIFTAYWDLIRHRWVRIVVFGTFSLGILLLVDLGFLDMNLVFQAQRQNSWANMTTQGGASDLIHDTGDFASTWLGSNVVVDKVVDGKPVKAFAYEPPVISTLNASIGQVTNAINGLAAADIYDKVDKEIQNALDAQNKGAYGISLPTYATPGFGDLWVGGGPILMPLIDGILNVFNWFTFVWAQWTLTRTLLVQCLFLQAGWHLGMYFLPLFILLAYFRSMQGFMTNLLRNYVAMFVAGYIMASVALILFSPGTWIGISTDGGKTFDGGIIQMAFNGLTLGVNSQGGVDPGSFPWLTRTYARQVARGQIVWMFGACGLILGQVYELVRGVMDGSFRSYFQPGSAGSSVVFGGK